MPEAYVTAAENRIAAMALALADRIERATEAAAGESGALPAALVSLHEWAGGRSIDVLAGALGVTHSRAVRVVDRLEAQGLAHRRRDGRAALVELTAAGRRRAERVSAARAAAVREALAVLDEPGRERLGGQAAQVLAGLAHTRLDARNICRLCAATACGHVERRCPVTAAVDAREGR